MESGCLPTIQKKWNTAKDSLRATWVAAYFISIFWCIMRIKDLVFACWMWADITLDGVTTNTYYDMAYNENSTYREWALNHQSKFNTTKIETVSEGYFICASLTWFLPPLSFVLLNCRNI